jgi:hypothetical protein
MVLKEGKIYMIKIVLYIILPWFFYVLCFFTLLIGFFLLYISNFLYIFHHILTNNNQPLNKKKLKFTVFCSHPSSYTSCRRPETIILIEHIYKTNTCTWRFRNISVIRDIIIFLEVTVSEWSIFVYMSVSYMKNTTHMACVYGEYHSHGL